MPCCRMLLHPSFSKTVHELRVLDHLSIYVEDTSTNTKKSSHSGCHKRDDDVESQKHN